MRLGIRSTTAATIAVGLFAIWLTFLGHGPFSMEGLSAFKQVVGMKIGLITIIATTVFLAVIVAERELTRKALRKSEGLFRAVVNNSPTKIHIKDMDGRFTLINKEAQKLYGITGDEGLGKTSLDLFPEEERTASMAHNKAVLESGQASEEEEFTVDGGVHMYLTVKFPILDDDIMVGIGAIGTDITEHKRAQNLLRESNDIRKSEQRLRQIFKTNPAGIAIISLETDKRLYLNPAMAKLFGATSVEQLMELDLKTTYANPADLDWLRSKTGDDFIEEAEIERVRMDGTTWWCLLNRRHIKFEGQDALMVWHYDISERKRTEDEVKTLNEKLEHRIEERTQELSLEVAERKWAETLQQGRNKVLGRLATGGSLEDVLALLITTSENLNPGMIGSVLLLDDEGKHLLHGTAPSLPDFYNEAIHGLEIGDGVGSCGTTAFTGETVIVDDVMSHPFWADFRDLTAKAGLKACWSQPILSSDNKVLGTFAMYYQEPREPTAQELEFMQGIGNLASISIERKRAKTIQERLTQAIETVPVGVALFDHDDRLVFFNDRYRELMKVADDVLKPGVTFETMIRTMVERDPVKDAQGREEDFIRDRVNTTATPKVLLIFAGKISG